MARRDYLFSLFFFTGMGLLVVVLFLWWAFHLAGVPTPEKDGIKKLLEKGISEDDVIHLIKGEATTEPILKDLLESKDASILYIASLNAGHLTKAQRAMLWGRSGEFADSYYMIWIRSNITERADLSYEEVKAILSIKQDRLILEALLRNKSLSRESRDLVIQSLSPQLREVLFP